MLEEIRIRGLGVIDDAELVLGPGFTVLTGETGAGKTMVLTGLGLLLGGRADPGAVRTGTARALVEGRVSPRPGSAALARATEAGAELDDGTLILARTVAAEGRSRAHVGGRAVPVGVLAELAEDLVAVHGQSDQLGLLRPARQREALDRFAGAAVSDPAQRYAERYLRLRRLDEELAELTGRARERAREADLLRFGLAEVAAADPQPGEDTALAAEDDRLAHADALREAAVTAHQVLTSDDASAADVGGLLATARRALELQREHDEPLAQLADRLAEVSYLLDDVAAELASYAAGVDTDPLRLAEVQQRRAALTTLTRKYGDTVDEVLAWADRSSRRLVELEDDGPRAEALLAERAGLLDELADLAGRLSAARAAAAGSLGREVTAELSALAMPHSRLEVAVRRRPDLDGLVVAGEPVAFGPTGVDEVELLFSSHAAAPARTLDRSASGGELSRLMLALEVVLGGADPVPTFVFDEVDAGVGGRAAVELGRRLARLARTAQVLVVTHLPQVAAFADRHLLVVKSDDGSITSSGVRPLDDAGRVRELSRMLAGLEGSATAEAHAEELLATAAASRFAAGGG
ncbi:MAG TPA: DNA repair protein RecN [Jiangellales bacterium]|nr:DNA repair protein RecN [Jiangellales bacterium]